MVDAVTSTEWMSNSNFSLKFEVNEYLSIHARCWLWRRANIGTAHMLQILQTDKTRKQWSVPTSVNPEFYSEPQCFILFTQLFFLPGFADGETEAKRIKDLSWAKCWCLLPLSRHVHWLLDFTALAAAGKTDCMYNVISSWIDLHFPKWQETHSHCR